MRRHHRLLVLGLAIALTPACSFLDDFDHYRVADAGSVGGGAGGGAGGGGGVGGGGPLTDAAVDASVDPLAQFLPLFFDGLCAKTIRCEEKLGISAFELFCHPGLRQVFLTQIFGGAIGFDPAMGEACLEGLASVDCSVSNVFFVDACEKIFSGFAAVGNQCTSDLSCAEGRCEELAEGCGNVCVDKADQDAACDNTRGDNDCDHPLRCRLGICQPPAEQGQSCDDSSDCVSLLWCDPSVGTCQPLPNSGEPCVVDTTTDYSDPCRGSLTCQLVSAGPPAVRQCLPGRTESQSCGPDQPCAPGLRCASSDDVCHVIALPGGPCVSKDDCPYDFECVAEVCVPYAGIGEACSPTLPCYQGSCVSGECALLGTGQTCDGTNGDLFGLCAGYCRTNEDATYTCEPRGGIGAPCEGTYDSYACEEGLTCAPADGGFSCQSC